jgi:hypothetical protein
LREPGFWNRSSTLYLFSEPAARAQSAGYSAWQGEIHLLSIYNRSLSAAEVLQNYRAGLIDSVPVASNATVMVQQNGEVGSHYDTPAFYLSPVPVLDLANLTLTATDADRDPHSPNYANSRAATQFYISGLPSKGTLYHMNGTNISSVPTIVATNGDAAFVRYRPLWGDISYPQVYTSFAYYAVDGTTGRQSDTATVSIKVTRSHEPPTPRNVTLEAKAGRLEVITLDGRAAYGSDISTYTIATLPHLGQLYQVYANRTVALNHRITSPHNGSLWTSRVAYMYTGPQNVTVSSSGRLTRDAFTYTLTDTRTTTSVPATVLVYVTPSLQAITAVNKTGAVTSLGEGRAVGVQVYGMDHQSLEHRDLCVRVVSVPTHGDLLATHAGQDVRLSAGDIVPHKVLRYPYSDGMALTYRAHGDGYFNMPTSRFDGTPLNPSPEGFAFRVLDCNNTRVTSMLASEPIEVVNVNEATSLRLAVHDFSILALGSIFERSADMDAAMEGRLPASDVAVLCNVSVVDNDNGVDPVVVHLSAPQGVVSLNTSSLQLADFTSTRYCQADDAAWRCSGSGEDSSMVFVAATSSLPHLLNGLTFRSPKSHVLVPVTVTIYDGAGGACLPESAFVTKSNRSGGCLATSVSFNVNVGESAILSHLLVDERASLPFAVIVACIGIGAFFVLSMLSRLLRRRKQRALKVAQQGLLSVTPSPPASPAPPSPEPDMYGDRSPRALVDISTQPARYNSRPQERYQVQEDGFIGAGRVEPASPSRGQLQGSSQGPPQKPSRRRRQRSRADEGYIEHTDKEGEEEEVVTEVLHEFMDTLTVLSPGARDRRLNASTPTRRAQQGGREREEPEVLQIKLFRASPGVDN